MNDLRTGEVKSEPISIKFHMSKAGTPHVCKKLVFTHPTEPLTLTLRPPNEGKDENSRTFPPGEGIIAFAFCMLKYKLAHTGKGWFSFPLFTRNTIEATAYNVIQSATWFSEWIKFEPKEIFFTSKKKNGANLVFQINGELLPPSGVSVCDDDKRSAKKELRPNDIEDLLKYLRKCWQAIHDSKNRPPVVQIASKKAVARRIKQIDEAESESILPPLGIMFDPIPIKFLIGRLRTDPVRILERCVELAVGIHDHDLQLQLLIYVTEILYTKGEFEKAKAYAEQVKPLAETLGHNYAVEFSEGVIEVGSGRRKAD